MSYYIVMGHAVISIKRKHGDQALRSSGFPITMEVPGSIIIQEASSPNWGNFAFSYNKIAVRKAAIKKKPNKSSFSHAVPSHTQFLLTRSSFSHAVSYWER
jgi:hypothetical protein